MLYIYIYIYGSVPIIPSQNYPPWQKMFIILFHKRNSLFVGPCGRRKFGNSWLTCLLKPWGLLGFGFESFYVRVYFGHTELCLMFNYVGLIWDDFHCVSFDCNCCELIVFNLVLSWNKYVVWKRHNMFEKLALRQSQKWVEAHKYMFSRFCKEFGPNSESCKITR